MWLFYSLLLTCTVECKYLRGRYFHECYTQHDATSFPLIIVPQNESCIRIRHCVNCYNKLMILVTKSFWFRSQWPLIIFSFACDKFRCSAIGTSIGKILTSYCSVFSCCKVGVAPGNCSRGCGNRGVEIGKDRGRQNVIFIRGIRIMWDKKIGLLRYRYNFCESLVT